MCSNKIHNILLQQFHLNTPHINIVKHQCFSSWTWRNRIMFERRSIDFKPISVPFTCTCSNVLCVAIVTSQSWTGLWRHCWCRQWVGQVHCTVWEWDLCMECLLRFISYYVLFSYKKVLRMVGCALWRPEAHRVVPWLHPCMSCRWVQGLWPRQNPVCLWSP